MAPLTPGAACGTALAPLTSQIEGQRYDVSQISAAEFLSTEGFHPPRVPPRTFRGGELQNRLPMMNVYRFPRTPRWIVSAALALGGAVLPVSVAHAQDYGAVERRLAAAVEAGEITEDQAEAMMAALKRAARERSEGADADMRAKRMRYAEYQRRLDAAVAKGELAADEAAARLAEARREMFGGEAESKGEVDPRAMRERYAQLEERIAAAVKSGRITEEQGAERLAQAMERMRGASRAKDSGGGQADMRALRMRYAEYEESIRASVAKGELSTEDAEAKLRLAREKMFGGEKTRKTGPKAEKKDGAGEADMRALRMRYAEFEKGIKARVEGGAMSPEEAEAKLRETREKMFGGNKARKIGPKAEKKAGDSTREKGAGESAMKARYDEYEKRLNAAVAKGEMTAEQAKAKLAEARKKMFGE